MMIGFGAISEKLSTNAIYSAGVPEPQNPATSIEKTSNTGWNGHARSTYIPSGDFEFTTELVTDDGNYFIGCDDGTSGNEIQNVKYNIYVNTNNTIIATHFNSYRTLTTFNIGDTISIKRSGSTVSVLKNGQVFYTFPEQFSGDLEPLFSAYYQGSKTQNTTIANDNVVWRDIVNCVVTEI